MSFPEIARLKELLELLREFGVTSFSGYFEGYNDRINLVLSERDPKQEIKAAEDHVKIMEKIESMKSVMKLDDENLIDQLFPLPVGDEEAQAPQN